MSNVINQRTLKTSIRAKGVGLTIGEEVSLTIPPVCRTEPCSWMYP